MQGALEMLMEARHLFWDAEVGGLRVALSLKPCREDPRLPSPSAPIVSHASLTDRKLGGFHVYQAFDAAH